MTETILQTQRLAESHALIFKDCGKGHVQIRGHNVLVNYWPESAKRTAYNVTTGEKLTNCTPWDAVRLCLKTADKRVRPDKKPSENGPDFATDPITTNPAGIVHLYRGKRPPWDLPGDFRMTKSDQLRVQARRLLDEAEQYDFNLEVGSGK